MSRIRIASNFLNGSASVIAPKIMVMSDIVLEYLDDEGRPYGHTDTTDERYYEFSSAGALASSDGFNGTGAHYFEAASSLRN